MFKKIVLSLIVLIVALVVVIAVQPAEFSVTRSTVVNASPQRVFEQVNDFHQWNNWSPWAKMDPKATTQFSGPKAGVGAMYAWSGNKKVGQGQMTIVKSTPPSDIQIKLEFIKPFVATDLTEFTFEPRGHQTIVSWTMSGHNNFMAKAFSLFSSMDSMIGPEFDKGLSNLKGVVESTNGQ